MYIFHAPKDDKHLNLSWSKGETSRNTESWHDGTCVRFGLYIFPEHAVRITILKRKDLLLYEYIVLHE